MVAKASLTQISKAKSAFTNEHESLENAASISDHLK
jgi:hypothetical protein